MAVLMRTPEVSVEAFGFQVSNLLRMELINGIEKCQRDGKIDNKLLSDIVRKHLNLSVSFVLTAERAPNAYVVPPKVDKNNPLINQWRRVFAANSDGISAINYTGGNAIGSVDFEKARVGGVFTKMNSTIYITRGAFSGYNDIVLTSAELTAIVMHELGHIMTYFATLGQTFTSAFILDGFVRSLTGTLDKEHRVKLMRDFEEETEVALSDKHLLSESEDVRSITTLVLSDIIDTSRSQYGTTLYDLRSWESLSDQFAARMGCSGDLATAMDKLYRIYEPSYFYSTLRYLFVEVCRTLLVLLLFVASVATLNIVGAVVIFLMLASSPHEREYDKPHERLLRLRNELVHELKSAPTKERNESLLQDIESIDSVLANVKQHQSFFERFWLVISPNTRRQVKMGKEIQELESLINNDLFVEAAKIKKLKY